MTAQANFLVNGVLKAQNQAIRRILHGVIMKILARDKKGRGVSSPFQGGVVFLLEPHTAAFKVGGLFDILALFSISRVNL